MQIHYRRRVLWDCPVDSLASFYEVLARNAASAAKGVQRNELREGLRRLQIGLTNAQLDRLVATVRVDQFGGISFDEFSQWLHVRDSDASIIVGSSVLCFGLSGWSHSKHVRFAQAAANVQRNEDSARHPRRTGRSPSHRAAAQAAGDRRRSRSPAAPRPKSAAKGRRSRSAPRSRRVSPHSKLEFNKPGREGVEYTGEDGQHGRPGAWDRMQSDNHTQALLAPKVQRELQRVLWQAITSRKRTLFGRPINDLEALFDAVRSTQRAWEALAHRWLCRRTRTATAPSRARSSARLSRGWTWESRRSRCAATVDLPSSLGRSDSLAAPKPAGAIGGND